MLVTFLAAGTKYLTETTQGEKHEPASHVGSAHTQRQEGMPAPSELLPLARYPAKDHAFENRNLWETVYIQI